MLGVGGVEAAVIHRHTHRARFPTRGTVRKQSCSRAALRGRALPHAHPEDMRMRGQRVNKDQRKSTRQIWSCHFLRKRYGERRKECTDKQERFVEKGIKKNCKQPSVDGRRETKES